MLLVIDVGNTNVVLGIYRNKVLIKDWRIRTIKDITVDEFNVIITALFFNDKIKINDICETIISCVVPPMVSILNYFCEKYLGHSPNWVDARSYKKMLICIDNPDELGADRIVNSVAAYDKYKTSLIVVDFGTATTFDSISDKGEYLGGAISPGIMISSDVLFNKASKLPRVDISKAPKYALGKDTVASMQSGIVFGYAGLVDGIVKKISKEMGGCPKIISTGGLAPLMFNVSDTIEVVEPLLTLEGLYIINTRL